MQNTFAAKVFENRYNRCKYNFENVVFTEYQFYHRLINLKIRVTIFSKRESSYRNSNSKSKNCRCNE